MSDGKIVEEIEITADSSSAVASLHRIEGLLEKIGSTGKKAGEENESAFGKALVKYNLASKALSFVTDAMKQGYESAREFQKTTLMLSTALDAQGRSVQASLPFLQAQASALEDITMVSDETIRSLQTQAVNMGVATDQVDKLVRASISLANATGTDVNSAFEDLIRLQETGQTRNVALRQAVAGLTDSQLRLGDAVGVVNGKFGTFLGLKAEDPVNRLTTAWGNLTEALAKFATAGGLVTSAMDTITHSLQGLTAIAEKPTELFRILMLQMTGAPDKEIAAAYQLYAGKPAAPSAGHDGFDFGGFHGPTVSMSVGGGGRGSGRSGTRLDAEADRYRNSPDDFARRGSSLPAGFSWGGDTTNYDEFSAQGATPEFASAVLDTTKMLESADKQRTKIAESGAKKRMEIAQKESEATTASYSQMTDVGMQVFSNLASSALDALERMANGQEVSGKAVAKAFLKSTGTMLIGRGINDEFAGISRALGEYGLDPTAEGLIALGGAEVAAGLAMVGGSLAIGAPKGADASGGSGASGGGASDFAAGQADHQRVKGGDDSKGSGTIVINVNGVMTSEEAGREILDAISKARQKGLA
jgi:hypothetical protein